MGVNVIVDVERVKAMFWVVGLDGIVFRYHLVGLEGLRVGRPGGYHGGMFSISQDFLKTLRYRVLLADIRKFCALVVFSRIHCSCITALAYHYRSRLLSL